MFDLANFLPYLVNRAGVRLAANFSGILKPYGLNVQEWRVLAVLHAHGAQRMSSLAELTSIDRTTLSRLTARMAAVALITRSRTDDDGREVRIAMSSKGQAVTDQLVPHAQRYEEVAVADLSDREIIALKGMLAKIYGNLDKL
jgi:MarR family transcriptional regulator, organic hydroperoxide resistance regulator